MIVELSYLKFSDRASYILSNLLQCVVRIEAVAYHETSTVGKQVVLHHPTTSGLGTPLVVSCKQL